MINGPGAAKIVEALFDHFSGLAGLGSWRVLVGWGYDCLLAA